MPATAVLSDAVVHTADIAHPRGISWVPEERAFVPVADFLARVAGPVGLPFGGSAVRRAARGCRLVATDVAWTRGDGPEVRAPAEVWLRLLSGRAVGPDEIEGDGAPALRAAPSQG